jgi:hypothetical protein
LPIINGSPTQLGTVNKMLFFSEDCIALADELELGQYCAELSDHAVSCKGPTSTLE